MRMSLLHMAPYPMAAKLSMNLTVIASKVSLDAPSQVFFHLLVTSAAIVATFVPSEMAERERITRGLAIGLLKDSD